MSETDSFIDEVSEEVRRDKMYGAFKRYGGIALAVVVAIVGAAAYNEWNKAQTQSANQATGDAILAALELPEASGRATALAQLEFSEPNRQALVRLQEAAMLVEDNRTQEAVAVYETLSQFSEADAIYSDLAKLKLVMLAPEQENAATLIEELAAVGRPFRLLAIEQRALARIRAGENDLALADLLAILQDTQTSQDLRERAQQLTIVLGGEVPQIPSLLPENGNG